MTRNVFAKFAALTLVLALASSAWGQDKFDLGKAPVMKVGDQFMVKAAGTQSVTVATPDASKTLQANEAKETGVLLYEVLAVDVAGKPTQLRCTIVSYNQVDEIKAPNAEKKEVAIADISGSANREKSLFVADTATFVSGKAKELKASQIALVKKRLSDTMTLPAYPEDMLDIVLPGKPVAVGESWQATPAALKKWTESDPSAKKINATAKSAEFKLVSVTDNVAAIQGVINATAKMGDMTMDMVVNVTAKLDTKTGLWQEDGLKGTIKGSDAQASVTLVADDAKSVAYKPGSGTASKLADDLNKLGWPKPGKDNNSYKNPEAGLSLDVPKGFQPEKADPASGLLAKFSSDNGVNIALNVGDLPLPQDVEEISSSVQANLANIQGYKQVAKEPVQQPGNVPGELITGVIADGKVTLLVLYVLDGSRSVTVSVAGASDDQTVADMKAIARSLRVFDRDYSGKGPG